MIDKKGKVYVCGTWETTVAPNWDGYTFFIARLNSDTVKMDWRQTFVLDQNADGSRRAPKHALKPGRDYHPGFHEDEQWEDYSTGNAAFAMAAAADSGVIVAGMGLSDLYYLEGWVMKINQNGTQAWQATQHRINTDWEDALFDVAVAKDSTIYTCGVFENSNSFGAGVFHVTKAGAPMTSAFPGVTDDDDWATAIALDEASGSNQNVYVT